MTLLNAQFKALLQRLHDHDVEFVIIGGVAASLLGSPTVTVDLDVCAPLVQPNLTKIHVAMQGINPRFRMRPDKLRLYDDPARLEGFKNLNLVTDLGVIDILGDLPEIGSFEDLRGRTVDVPVGGFTCKVIDLDTLITVKRQVNREKDKYMLIHLEALRQRQSEGPAGPSSTNAK